MLRVPNLEILSVIYTIKHYFWRKFLDDSAFRERIEKNEVYVTIDEKCGDGFRILLGR